MTIPGWRFARAATATVSCPKGRHVQPGCRTACRDDATVCARAAGLAACGGRAGCSCAGGASARLRLRCLDNNARHLDNSLLAAARAINERKQTAFITYFNAAAVCATHQRPPSYRSPPVAPGDVLLRQYSPFRTANAAAPLFHLPGTLNLDARPRDTVGRTAATSDIHSMFDRMIFLFTLHRRRPAGTASRCHPLALRPHASSLLRNALSRASAKSMAGA